MIVLSVACIHSMNSFRFTRLSSPAEISGVYLFSSHRMDEKKGTRHHASHVSCMLYEKHSEAASVSACQLFRDQYTFVGIINRPARSKNDLCLPLPSP